LFIIRWLTSTWILNLVNQKPTSSVQNTHHPKQNTKTLVKEDTKKTNIIGNQKVHLLKIIEYIFNVLCILENIKYIYDHNCNKYLSNNTTLKTRNLGFLLTNNEK